ncbi:hypothetical protein FBR02_16590 [Anaerolineae bacterium CFX9]|nr:hypothetical protein [Kamptonema cortianum]MDL1902372.1 hypothetical protein [Anaerolineae bacterium CFX9]
MLPDSVIAAVDQYWAGITDCDPGMLRHKGINIVKTEKSPGITALSVTSGSWVISCLPEVPDAAVESLSPHLLSHDFEDSSRRQAIHAILERCGMIDMYGPSELLYVTRSTFTPFESVAFRKLTPDDLQAIQSFREGMGGIIDWRVGDPAVWPYVIGTFDEDRLVAVGAVRNWDNVIGETYVDTLPSYRGKGLANSLTSETTRWILHESQLIAQAGGEIVNPAAGRISRRLGYQLYGVLLMNNLCRRT